MSLKTWVDGEKGFVIKQIIDNNFKVLGKHLPSNILALTTDERLSLGNDYLREGLIVYDITRNRWYQYKSGIWNEYEDMGSNGNVYKRDITQADWDNGSISIPFAEHLVDNPIVELYIVRNGVYTTVLGGVNIDLEQNVILSSDINFNGRVIIK